MQQFQPWNQVKAIAGEHEGKAGVVINGAVAREVTYQVEETQGEGDEAVTVLVDKTRLEDLVEVKFDRIPDQNQFVSADDLQRLG